MTDQFADQGIASSEVVGTFRLLTCQTWRPTGYAIDYVHRCMSAAHAPGHMATAPAAPYQFAELHRAQSQLVSDVLHPSDLQHRSRVNLNAGHSGQNNRCYHLPFLSSGRSQYQ